MAGNLLVDAILVAMTQFPEFYRGMKFNYSAMWVYLRNSKRIFGHEIETWDIVRKRREIRRYHPFSISMFLLFSSLLGLLAWRGNLLSKRPPLVSLTHAPENIGDLVKGFANSYAPKA